MIARAPAQGSLRMSFELGVYISTASGFYQNATMTAELVCVGPGCPSDPPEPVSKSMSAWRDFPTAKFAFAGRLSLDTLPAGGSYSVRFNIVSPVFNQTSPARLIGSYRCDRAKYPRRGEGCVFDLFAPTVVFDRSNPTYGQVAEHIHDALARPGLTRPEFRNKKIPSTLHRRHPAKPRSPYAIEFCRRDFPKSYRPPSVECDEYPFNASQERPVRGEPKNFSVRPVACCHNSSAGRYLNEFYRANRVLDGDEYEVRTKK